MLVYAIDDEKYVLAELRDAIAEALPQAVIRSFSDASATLKALEADGEQPDIVFSDICMPGMGGLELAVAVKKRSPGGFARRVQGSCQRLFAQARSPRAYPGGNRISAAADGAQRGENLRAVLRRL